MTEETGMVVISRMGRDKGRTFLITGRADAQRVYICDGELRKAQKPKMKKLKHLFFTGKKVEGLEKELERNTADAFIRKAISALADSDKA